MWIEMLNKKLVLLREENPEVFFDWLHTLESFFSWYDLSKE
jgi:hypothetical protein